MSVASRPLAILAYGSLLHDPGPELKTVIVARTPCRTPFPVEYGRASQRWGGGPVLVPHAAGGPVEGALLLLACGLELGVAVQMLADREGLSGTRGVVEVLLPGERLVLAARLPRNLPLPDMSPASLARRAAASVQSGPRNGVAYLRETISCGVETPLTAAYARAILSLSGASSLEEAERRLVAFPESPEGSGDGLG